MTDSSQFSYSNRVAGLPGGSLLGRLAAMILGIGALGIAIFLGAIFLAVVVGLVLVVGTILSIRVWWLKRKMQQYMREHGDLEAEYVEVHERSNKRSGNTLPGELADEVNQDRL